MISVGCYIIRMNKKQKKQQQKRGKEKKKKHNAAAVMWVRSHDTRETETTHIGEK